MMKKILMTAIATLFAMLLLALGCSEGINMQKPMGIAVMGGLFTSTFLSLAIVPCLYEVFDEIVVRLSRQSKEKKRRKENGG